MSSEDVQAKYETDETPESHFLIVHVPDGFTKEDISAKIEYDLKRVRVSGERLLANNEKTRFNVMYEVPEYCNIDGIKGKFDGKKVIITMQKDPKKVSKQEPQQSEEQEETEPNPENEKDGTPPSQTENDDDHDDRDDHDHDDHDHDDDDHVPKSTTEKSKEEVGHDTPPTPPKATQEDPMPQKDKDGISHEPAVTKVGSTKLPKGVTPSLPPNPPEATEETMPQKGKQGISHKSPDTTDAKLQTDENDKEKQRVIGKEESEDHPKKTLETRKSLEESKGIGTLESFSTKDTEKEKRSEIKGKVMDNDVASKKSDGMAKPESTTRTRIKEVAASASQAVTNLTKRFNEEDKQRLIYMGAAVIVVALGVYATYKLRSSRRL